MFRIAACLVIGFSGCAVAPSPAGQQRSTTQASQISEDKAWTGVYSSPIEISPFQKSVLVIVDPLFSPNGFILKEVVDVVLVGKIPQDYYRGRYMAQGDVLLLPLASGFMYDNKPSLSASISQYVRTRVNGHTVLMEKKTYELFREKNELYDYGILLKVSDDGNPVQDLDKVLQRSIKVLYTDPSKPWHDPFVDGTNVR